MLFFLEKNLCIMLIKKKHLRSQTYKEFITYRKQIPDVCRACIQIFKKQSFMLKFIKGNFILNLKTFQLKDQMSEHIKISIKIQMGLFFWKNKNTPQSMMFKFQEKTKNKQKTKVSKSKMNQLYSALENETYLLLSERTK